MRHAKCSIESNPAHHARMEEFSWSTPYFPNSLVWPMPICPQPLQNALSVLPAFIRNGMAIFVREIHGIHHLAVNIELQLLVSGVADPYRPRILVTAEMIQRNLLKFLPAIKPVHELYRAALCVVAQPAF